MFSGSRPPKRRSAKALRATAAALILLAVAIPILNFVIPRSQTEAVPTNRLLYSTLVLGAIAIAMICVVASFSFVNFAKPKDSQSSSPSAVTEPGTGGTEPHIDVARQCRQTLFVLILLWYIGNYYHNITATRSLSAGGGTGGYPLLISTCYQGVGALYALFLWAAPDARPLPKITWSDYVKTLPVGFAAAGAHMASCFALSAGSLSFVQIVKAMEPAFAAVIGVMFYSTNVSAMRWMCLVPIIGGVLLASMGELGFAWSSLFVASVANAFAAIKGNENKKLFMTEGLKDRMGSVGNQFAITTLNSFFFCLVLTLICEGHKLGSFVELLRTGGSLGEGTVVFNNMIASGLWFYFYNELSTITLDKTSAVTQSVLNTAKRAFVMVGAAIVLREDMSALKLTGSLVSIGGVFLYSNIDHWKLQMDNGSTAKQVSIVPCIPNMV